MDGVAYKGIPLGREVEPKDIAALGLNVRAGDLATPAATINLPHVQANAAAMSAYCLAHGVQLAPHAKTTLAAGLLEVQRAHGVWAMTGALPRQVALLWQLGFDRVLLANEVGDPSALHWLAAALAAHDQRSLLLYVDSREGLDLLAAAARDAPGATFDVLVEIGHAAGRTGCRDLGDALELARAVTAAPGLRLAGVAGYEGTIGGREAVATIDAFLGRMVELAGAVLDAGLVRHIIVTAGGSVFFDRVTEVLGAWAVGRPATVVLRSGCYLLHDHGLYATATPAAVGVAGAPRFSAALTVWSRVVSAPEPGLALVDAGRRDLSHDAGLPVPLRAVRGGVVTELDGARVTALSDQHASVASGPSTDLRCGDLVQLGISHPCTTLDRHRALFLVDESDQVIGVVETGF